VFEKSIERKIIMKAFPVMKLMENALRAFKEIDNKERPEEELLNFFTRHEYAYMKFLESEENKKLSEETKVPLKKVWDMAYYVIAVYDNIYPNSLDPNDHEDRWLDHEYEYKTIDDIIGRIK
jgi:hypothetical protein